MAKNNNLTDFLVDLADGIYKAETGVATRPTTEKIDPQDFRSRVEAIPANTLTNNAVARANTTISVTADDTNDKLTITAGNNQSTGYVAGANKTTTATVTLTASGANVTATVGNKSVTKTVATVGRAATTMSAVTDTTNKKLTYTASNNQATGYVAGANKTTSATVTLSTNGKTVTMSDGTNSVSLDYPTHSGQTVTPSVTSQTVSVSGKYMTGNVVVGPIPNQKGPADVVANGPTVTVPSGWYPGDVTETVTVVDRAATTMDVSVVSVGAGLFYASAENNQATGYVTGTNASASQMFKVDVQGPTVSIYKGESTVASTEIISKTVTTATRGATTVRAQTLGTNVINIGASNVQATGYVQGSTANDSLKVYITRTNNTVYLRPGSTSSTAILSYTVPTTSCPSPTITLNTATGVITANYKITTAGYVRPTVQGSKMTIKLAEDNKF